MKTCFISAPSGFLTQDAEALLSRLGFRVVTPSDSPPGHSIAESLLLLIQQSQLVIAVWDANAPGLPNVAFELGIAVGASVPVILMTAKPQNIPTNLVSFPQVVADPQDLEALEFAITQIANRAQDKRVANPGPTGGSTTARISGAVVEAINGIEERKGQLWRDSDLATLVTRALESRAASVISEACLDSSERGTLRPDYLVFDPELESLLGSPLLIEVKDASRYPQAEQEGRRQLQRYLATGVARWGLLLVHPNARRPGYFRGEESPTNILVLGLVDFLRHLVNESLPSTIRRLRNQYVHREG